MTMRVIHTADVHLDLSYAGAGFGPALASQRRQSVRDVLRLILQRARVWPADAVLIAGDLFELDRVSSDTIAFLQSEFRAIAPIRVFIAPGNHDPYMPHSPYALEQWPENVTIFSKPMWSRVQLDTVPLTIHGFAFDGYDISRNPFSELKAPDDGRVHIAIAHGSERGNIPDKKQAYAPFRADEIAQEGLAYLALGHYHAYTQIAESPTTICYSGAPEGHDFSETGMRHYLEIEIENGIATVAAIPSSRTLYVEHTIDCTSFTNTSELVDAIRAIQGDISFPRLARITLTGLCLPAIRNELIAVQDIAGGLFQYLQLIDDTTPLDDYSDLESETTTLGEFIRRISAEIADTTDPDRKRMLERAREVGLASCRGQQLAINGIERSA